MTYSKPAHDTVDLDLDLIPNLGSRYKDYKAFDPGYAVPFTSCIFNFGFIFGANRHWGGGSRIIHGRRTFPTSEHFFTSLAKNRE